MKSELHPTAKKLSDYRKPDFSIETADLKLVLHPTQTEVTSELQIYRCSTGSADLVLQGQDLTLLDVAIDGKRLSDDAFSIEDNSLVIPDAPERFRLTIKNHINPEANTALEGLYLSDGAFCTQCEAEGFRRITYYLDRPDVLAKFTTRIEADKAQYPYLLSNGNPIERGELPDGKHFAVWQDPFPKPCYLFALVAGDFDLLEDHFTTQSGREVLLQLFVDKGNAYRGHWALESLKRSMAWDEQRFGLEYDLDIYMVVAVDFFNMGAMENKGLNVFNSKYVLAEPKSATDTDFFNIESVIGHEYFHNWTGNRVTCRDWFQLSLKEGLTVFRDQEFSADMGAQLVNRIDNVKVIRTQQFAEDAGPMAHPIRPQQVIEMNNFYTVTVYNKGAEVIRMMHTLLGEQDFRKGMDLYFERHDGQAVTCDDFVAAMADASGLELDLFKRWYQQSGTPVVTATEHYDQERQCYRLTLRQATPATADQKVKLPLHIPFAISLYQQDGSIINLDAYSFAQRGVLHLTEEEQTFEFSGIGEKPRVSLLEGFSAPVKVEFDYTDEHLVFLIEHARNGFSQWDAAQMLYSRLITNAAASKDGTEQVALPPALTSTLGKLLEEGNTEPGLMAEICRLPAIATLVETLESVDVEALTGAHRQLTSSMAKQLSEQWSSVYKSPKGGEAYSYTSDGAAKRALNNIALHYLAIADENGGTLVADHYEVSDNMTDSLAALEAANYWSLPQRDDLMRAFESEWSDDGLVMDKWFSLQARNPDEACTANIKSLYQHKAFSKNNPNRVRALVGTFAAGNFGRFHSADGQGYQLLADMVQELNKVNPQVAARIITPLTQWSKLDAERQSLIKAHLKALLEIEDLSPDLFEVISKSLAMA